MADPRAVSAVIVTRGNVDLQPIVDSLIFDEVIVYDNSAEPEDAMTYGRALALSRAKHRIIYSQDDDLLHTEQHQLAILDAYEPGVLTGCMWPEWSDGARKQGIPGGYDDLAFAGSGSIYDREVPGIAAARYLEHYPLDDFFRLWADCIIGILAPSKNLPLIFEELPCADDPYRMCKQPDAAELKGEAIRRARRVRDLTLSPGGQKRSAHSLYMDELEGRLARAQYGQAAA